MARKNRETPEEKRLRVKREITERHLSQITQYLKEKNNPDFQGQPREQSASSRLDFQPDTLP